MGAADEIKNQIILFDGVCNLCNSSVNYVIDHDPEAKFRFAPLQSAFAHDLVPDSLRQVDSIVLFKDGQFYQKSDAALHIAKDLQGPVRLAWHLRFFPRWIRDKVYDFVGANRYRWFGQTETCRMPTAEITQRFISSPIVS